MASIASAGRSACMADTKVPGHTQLTRIPSRAYSTAATFARWMTPAFVTQYGAECDQAVRPATEAVTMIDPDLWARITGTAARIPLTGPSTLTPNARSQSSVARLWILPFGDRTPALLMSTSSLPKRSTARLTTASTCAKSLTSARRVATCPAPPGKPETAACRAVSLRSLRTRSVPGSAVSWREIAEPSVPPAPRIAITRRGSTMGLLSYCSDQSVWSDRRDGGERAARDARQPQRRRRQQEAAAAAVSQPLRQVVQVPQLTERDAELEQAQVMDGDQGVRLPARRRPALDRVVVGDQGRHLRLRDPLEEFGVLTVQVRVHGLDLRGIRVAIPGEHLSREPGMDQYHVAGPDHDVVRRHDLPEGLHADRPPLRRVIQVVRHVDQDAAALDTVRGHVLQAEVAGEADAAAAVALGVRPGPHDVVARPVAVVVDRLGDPVPVGVEHGALVDERVPLRRVLQPERHHVVGPDVDQSPADRVLGDDVEERVGLILHVLGRPRDRGIPALVQRRPAGEVKRQAQREAETRLHLPYALQHLLLGNEVDTPKLIVLAPVTPRGAVGPLRPSFRHVKSSLYTQPMSSSNTTGTSATCASAPP